MAQDTAKTKAQLIAELQELRTRFTLAQEQAESELAQGRQLLSTVLDNLPVSVYVKDLQGRKILANKVDLEIVGRPEDEVLGKTDAELFPPEVAEHFWQDDQAVLSGGKIVRNHEELSFNQSQGRQFWQLTSKVPLYDSSGKLTGLVGIGVDITERKQVEEELSKSRALFHSLVESIPHNVLSKDVAGRFTFANRQHCLTDKKTLEEIIGKTDFELYPPELAAQYRADDIHVMETGQVIKREELHQSIGDENFYVEVVKAPVYDANNQVTGVIGIFWDITERKHMQDAVQKSRNMLHQVLDTIPQRVFWKDRSGRYLGCNKPFVYSLGLKHPNQVIGKTDFELEDLRQQAENHQEDDRDILENNRAKHHVIECIQLSDGSEKWLDSTKIPLVDETGHPFSVLGVFEDITERKQAEEEILGRAERHRVILDTAMSGFWLADMQGRLLEVNQTYCEMSGYSAEELLSMHISDLDDPENANNTTAHIQKLILQGQDRFESRHRRKDGTAFDVEVSAQYHSFREGQIVAFLQDITERKRVEENLRESEKRLRTMLDISLAMSATLEMNMVLQSIVKNAADFIGGLASGAVYTLKGDELFLEATAPPLPPGFPNELRRADITKHLHIQSAVFSGTTVILPDTTVAKLSDNEKIVVEALGLRSIAYIPLMISEKAIGVLIVASVNELRAFSDEEIALYAGFAGQAAQTIENIRLYQSELEYASRLETQIAERKQAEDTLRERESLLRIAGQTAQFGGWSVDLCTQKVAWSDQVALIHDKEPGYSPCVHEGIQFYAPEWKEKITRVFNACVQEGTPYDEEMEIITARERRVWVRTIGHAVRDGLGKIVGVQGSFQDISQRKNSEHDLEVAYDSTLRGWSSALELREHETAGHSQRVVEITLELARKMGVDEEKMVHIQRGALLHDIGKMGIPDSILVKPGPLSDDEWVTMRQHPEFAYCMLSKIDYLKPALEIPHCHHEKWDGSGYPRGLKGNEIPLAARIFAIVDAWDALSHDRPYRPAWPLESVIEHLKNQSGRQFDPQVVDKFIDLLEKSE